MAKKKPDPTEMIEGLSIRGETVEISYDEIIKITAKAALLNFGGEEVWVPKSLIADADDKKIWVAEFFAEEHDLV